jgi:RND family efflux transporter MFP subunit
MTSLHAKYQNIDTLDKDEAFVLAQEVSDTVNKGIKVLDATITSSEYDDVMLTADKKMLFETLMGSPIMGDGILTILNMYKEQKSMLAKETTVSSSEYTNETLMLERLKAEKEVAEKELLMAKAEKDRMLADVRNMKSSSENDAAKMVTTESADKIISLAEADRMVTEGEKMMIDAQTSHQAATEALSVLESAGFSNEIKAPFSGKITKRYINVGESIAMSSPVFDIVQDGTKNEANIFVRFEVPESEFSHIKMGQEISFFRTIEPLKKYTAIVQRIAPAINTTTKGVIIEATVKGIQSESILIGSSIRVSVMNTGDVLLSIPTKTVQQDEQGNMYVWKVLKDTIQKQIIQTSRTYGDQVFVNEGLKIGTKVIVDNG